MASSIHIGKVSSGSFLHNDRTQKVSYLIDDSSLNEYSRSSSDCLLEFQSLKLQASENYTKLTNQKMQKSTIFLKEAIVNLQEHHTLKDLEPIKERLESYGFKVMQMSIHRDEGFINPENKKEKNYHAHITMFNLDIESGKSVKFGKNYRTELSKLQTFTAKTLQMERGKVSVKEHADELRVTVSKASKRLDTHDYKKAMKIKEEALRSEQYNFKAMQQKITSLEALTTEQKRELHSLNSAVKNDKGTIEELNKRIEELTEHKKELISAVKEALKPEQIQELKTLEPLPAFQKSREFVKKNILGFQNTQNKALQATKPLQEENETLKERLSVLKQDMSVLNTSLIESRAEVQQLELKIEKKEEIINTHEYNDSKLLQLLKIEPVKGLPAQQLVLEEYKKLQLKNKTLSNTVKALETAFNELYQLLPQAIKSKVQEFGEVVTAIKQQLSPKQQEPVQKQTPKNEFYQRMENIQKTIKEEIQKSDKPVVITREMLQEDDRQAAERLRAKQQQQGYSR